MRKEAWTTATLAAGLLLMAGQPAAAAPFDGSAPFICAVTELSSCVEGGDCRPETPESVNVPRFLRLDVGGKTIGGVRPDGEARTTPIQFEAHEAGRMVLAGVDGPLSWHLDIDEAGGGMLLAATGTRPDGSLTVGGFGACLVP